MNLFLCSPRLLDNKRLGKQCIEALQIYAVAAHELGLPAPLTKRGKPYGLTHQHHPVTRWAAECGENAAFCVDYCLDCCREWHARYSKLHGCDGSAWQVRSALHFYEMPRNFIVCRTGMPLMRTDYGTARTLYAAYVLEKQHNKIEEK